MKKARKFKFSQLSAEAKKVAISENWDVAYPDGWNKPIMQDYVDFLESVGVEIVCGDFDYNAALYYTQFVAFTDVNTLIEKVKVEGVEEEYGYLLGNKLPKLNVDKRVLKVLADTERLEVRVGGKEAFLYNGTKFYKPGKDLSNIEGELEKLEAWVYEVFVLFDNTFFSYVDTEEENRNSKEFIADCLRKKGYIFNKEGKLLD